MRFSVTHPLGAGKSRVRDFIKMGCARYPVSDEGLFAAGYGALCRHRAGPGTALEICGGQGELAAAFARAHPGWKVIGSDLYTPDSPESRAWLQELPNLSYRKISALDLSSFEAGSFDLIWGQAALHHLAHAPGDLCREALRVLRPGGKLVFIYEPLGHNWLVAATRAIRMSAREEGDESNLYLSQFEKMAKGFSACEVQVFNLLGYPMKAVSGRWLGLARWAQKADDFLFGKFPGLLKFGANCNIIFTK